MSTIVLTGGGTGGHIMPNIALLPELKNRFDNIYYAGVKGGREEGIAAAHGIPFIAIPAIKLDRSDKLSNLAIPFKFPQCVKAAKKALKEIKPDVVLCKGGFVSLPCAYAAKFLKIPVITHESDLSLGVANRLISRFSKATITSYECTDGGKHAVYIGNPLRDELLYSVASPLGITIDRTKPVILIVGGSCGARSLNEAIWSNLDILCDKYNILHITGSSDNPIHDSYYPIQYTQRIFDYYKAADAVISRCGAGAACELLALRKRILFVPLNNKASRGDQVANAEYYRDRGYALVCSEAQLRNEPIYWADKLLSMPAPDYVRDRNINSKIAQLCYNVSCAKA
ncbi:MAG: UDP-N-acetylglucosamine--N-acetylmuramyl-(pentapeptide) pyrophosphoryl-undecaprenol N-acetylglucosamine transferase [Clostridia bacterium]|nr:UDP-N-acetylglucosamine--N-acetylmuramyl-(pentapeptide) pyrophosphoryl-undecaprenol N-acetylglucosamine transferase [Clostridia bacterium]